MDAKSPLTPEQVKAQFRDRGETITEWAAARGYTRRDVYRVLNGQLKAHFGRAHEIAVALGLKVAHEKDMPTDVVGNPQSKVAA